MRRRGFAEAKSGGGGEKSPCEKAEVERMLAVGGPFAGGDLHAEAAAIGVGGGDAGVARDAVDVGESEFEDVFRGERPFGAEFPAVGGGDFAGGGHGGDLRFASGGGFAKGLDELRHANYEHCGKCGGGLGEEGEECAFAEAAPDAVCGHEKHEKHPYVGLLRGGPCECCAEEKPMAEAVFAHGAVYEAERPGTCHEKDEEAEVTGGVEGEIVAHEGIYRAGTILCEEREAAAAKIVCHAERGEVGGK